MSLPKGRKLMQPESVFVVWFTHLRRISMSQSTTPMTTEYSHQASLAALVAHLKARGIFDELRTGVHIAQKTVKDSPQDKVQDILLALLAGVQSLVQRNTVRQQDAALQRAAGRSRAAEQSVA